MLGVTIGKYHTWRDWGLRWVGISISAPEAKTHYIEVPGKSGDLDLSEILTGFPTYEDRDLTLTFDTRAKSFDEWQQRYSDILNACHGQRLKIQLDTDSVFYYIGRISVSSKKDTLETDTLTISARVEPYKLELTSGIEPWLWDPFSFETGIVREYADLVVDGSLSLLIPGTPMRVIPTIICSTAMTVEYNGTTYNLAAGENKITELCLPDGENILLFKGNGTVSVDYRGGRL